MGWSLAAKRPDWGVLAGMLLALATAEIVWAQLRSGPRRPRGVSSAAVLIPAGPRSGKASSVKSSDWLDCSLNSRRLSNRCRILDANGKLEYQDTFLPYEASGAIPADHLRIAIGAEAERIEWHRFGKKTLPVIFLRNGTTLVPLAAYSADPRHEDE